MDDEDQHRMRHQQMQHHLPPQIHHQAIHHDSHMQHIMHEQEMQRQMEQRQQQILHHEHLMNAEQHHIVMHQRQQQMAQDHHLMQQHGQQHGQQQRMPNHGQMQQDDDIDHNAIQVAAEDIITAVNSIGDSTSGLDNGLGEPTAQEQEALAEALASAPRLLLQSEKCLSIQEIVNLCRDFEMCDKVSRREFAKARDVSRTKFDRYWKNYRIGKYSNVKLANKRRRVKPGKYLAVEMKLVEFLEERKASGIKNDLSWIVLSEKALELSKDVLPEDLQKSFRASAGWLYGVLHRNGFIHVDLSGNDNNIAGGPPAVVIPSMKAVSKLAPQPAIVVNGDVTMV